MENLSHSLHPSKLSKRAAHPNAAPKGIYDDVFGGPPKFGVPTLSPRIEDYSEIFGGFHAPRVSSIPVLDLPVVDEPEAFFDVRSSGFDYSEVFGGFNGLDFADGFEELVADPRGGGSFSGSSEEAWTPAASECLSEETDHSGSNHGLSNGDSHQSYDGNIEYTLSYHKTNPRSDSDTPNGLRHASPVHVVPGFSYIIDQTNPAQVSGNVHQFYQQGGDDGFLDVGYGREMVKEKCAKKTKSDTSNGSVSSQDFANDVGQRREHVTVSSCPDKGFVTISELSLRTVPSHLPPPSRPPPVLDAKTGYASGSGSSRKTASPEGTEGDSSPSFFDVEVDATSSAAAAASAAAMKEAVAKARAQLRNAKELMERKKDANSDLREARRKHCKDEIAKGSCQRESNGAKIPMVEEKQNLVNTSQTNPVKTQGKESSLPKVVTGFEEVGEWKEAPQFFELVKNERPKVAVGEMDKEKQLSESSNNHNSGLKEVKLCEEVYQGHENYKNKAVKEARVVDVKEPREYYQAERGKLVASKEAYIQKDQEKKDKAPFVVCQQEEAHKILNDEPNLIESSERMTGEGGICQGYGAEGTQKRQTEVSKREEKTGILRTVLGQQKLSEHDETERRHNVILKSVGETATERETEKVLTGIVYQEHNGRTLKRIDEQEKRERIKEAHDREEHERRLKINLDLAEKQKRQEAAEREERENRLEEAPVREEGEKRLKQVHKQEDGNKLSKDNEREETDKREKEAFKLEDPKRRQEKASEHEEKKRKQWKNLEKEEKEKMLKEVFKLAEKEKSQREARERQEDNKRLEEAPELEENDERVRKAYEREGTPKVPQTLQHTKENEKNIKEDPEIDFNHKNAEAAQRHEVRAKYGQEYEQEEINDALKETFELEQIDIELCEGTYFGESNVFGEAQKKDETCQQNNIVDTQSDDIAAEILRKPSETVDAFIDADNGMTKNQSQSGGRESAADEMEKTTDRRKEVSGSTGVVLENGKDENRVGDSIKPPPSDNGLKAAGATGGTKFETISRSQHQQGKTSLDQGDKEKNISKTEVHINEERREDKFASSQSVGGGSENGNRMDLLQSAARNTQRTSQPHASATESRKENLNRTLTPEEKDAERVRKDQEMEKGRLRKIEEEREREREREKDRMAVDRAILEARERVFSEARERPERAAVEKATAEARQRSLIEARERLEKLCAEAKERSFPEKDAKMRERAAVERAMAEARQRAAEKTAFEGRERVDRSLSDNFSAPRYNGMRQSSLPSDLRSSQDQSVGSSSTSRHQYSSGYVASSSMEKPEGDEGESDQRCRARLERHRRTAERAANALAEKNTRDLLVQREQAERNRLAETLDAEVKRWSNGKEGNLRALLSTLQYILGPDSGWQPVPLTEVITSTAVKKAYRKATLCVHPDKLQQRGASIQQKYICEKVFDLLKEAWNRFNSEER